MTAIRPSESACRAGVAERSHRLQFRKQVTQRERQLAGQQLLTKDALRIMPGVDAEMLRIGRQAMQRLGETPPGAGREFVRQFGQCVRRRDGLDRLWQIDVRGAAGCVDAFERASGAGGAGDLVASPGRGPTPKDRRPFAVEEVERLRPLAPREVLLPDGPAALIVAGEPGLEQLAGSRAMPQRRAMEGTAGGLVREGDGHGIRFRVVDGRVQGDYLTRVAADGARSGRIGSPAMIEWRNSALGHELGAERQAIYGDASMETYRSVLRQVLFALCCTVTCMHVAAAEEATPAPPPKLPAPEGATRLSPKYDVWVDAKRGVVLVDGQVSLRRGMLEMFACIRNTKEHESVVTADTQAFLVHAGLLRLGAEPGHPAQFVPEVQAAGRDRDRRLGRVAR